MFRKWGRHILFLLLVLVASCTGKEEIELPKQPQGYQELLTIHKAGLSFISCEEARNGETILEFEGRSLTVKPGGIRIKSHVTTDVPDISLSQSNNMWVVGGQLCGIRDYSGLSDEQCCPVYTWYDRQTLHMVIANGNRLDFPFVEKAYDSPRTFRVPTVRIETDGRAPIADKENYVSGKMTVEDLDGIYSKDGFSGTMKIRGRGNSTWDMPKKPYKIKLDEKASLLGMPSDRDWVLLANYSDKSLLRNVTAMEISRICGMKWTPQFINVELYLNGVYLGVYNLGEQKEVAGNRLDVDIVKEGDNEGEALSGGYYFEMEQNMDETWCWWTGRGIPMMLLEPENPTEAQLSYVQDYFSKFENALFGSEFTNPVRGYAGYIDVDSFVNYYIIQELTKNIDGNTRKSTFMTKERGGKLEMCHVWDFDLAFGNADYFDGAVGNGPENWWIKDYGLQGWHSGWYYRLFEDDAFVSKVKSRWNSLKKQLEAIPDFIDFTVAELQDAPERNFKKWNILNTYVWPNVKVIGSYEGEIEYLKDFYTQRFNWIDQRINSL